MLSKLKSVEFSKFAPLFVTLAFILILIQYSFHPLESIFYDFWIKTDLPAKSFNNPIVLISLDEESDQFLGETYPYTYASHTRLMNRLVADEPALMNYFVSLLEPDSQVEARYQTEFHEAIKSYSPSGDKFKFGTEIDQVGELVPPEALKDIGYYLGQLYRDQLVFSKDEVVRRAILNISGEDSLHLWTAKRYRELQGLPALDATAYKGAYYNSEADANFALFKYSGNPSSNRIPSIPFHRVVVGNFPKGFFKDKIVLIGPQYLSNSNDFVLTPFDKENAKSPKLAVHADVIEALISEKTIYDVKDITTQVAALLIAILLSFVISRVQPVKGLMITILIIIGILASSYIAFIALGWWIKLSHLVLSIFVVYYIWVPFRAIEEYQTRYAIEEETKLLKQVDNLKQNFISLMSHDLKTPVAKIAGIADILKIKFNNTPEQTELIDNVMNSTKELNNFINSILDLTKIESQNLTLSKESKDVNKIIESIVEKLEFEATNKHINIELELSPLYPIQIDTVLMNRVISNLIENAIKYAGSGKSIWVKTWDDAEWVYIEVKDNGVGVGPDDLAHIFDKFYRVKNDSSHSIKGSGLGLYLVKYFIELHNGVITATSQFGEGTSFIIKLKNE
ncbi:MAG: CHASE2 and HATPase_c domain-containing protein [Bacteriovoracaceae bacterium]|nr:CHASE2 and HATPase_c domain-containing protein [Bacteriovoracaceae bacterium]